ncbi:sigma-54-dependent Fis family transcriptional regulator [Mycobacterium sp. KBS0706]|uniref:sigma-54-dependent Fis family transcriptional regulator n=1 Tax=Mycobacterium sp. KBS0706 TaxID=2578109 RepID=UPI00110F6AE0|nr:sigma-54-dependent Fis family transcriptional regulator [Mycobacterium sp. KBS0706]TSD83801.1 sigma-54-dependent Fis family transcriptional regulator [Mycobacterium sp. KBS0706]
MPRRDETPTGLVRPGVTPAFVGAPCEATDTMLAWERYLSGATDATVPAQNFVVASWQRSLHSGVNPGGRAAPLAAGGDAMGELRRRHGDLVSAAAGLFSDAVDLLAGSGSIMLLTNPDGVVLQAVGDMPTLEKGENINLMSGGNWGEGVIGTNGIGTAIATGRPAQIHAAEHFCEGIKGWTCAGSPIFEPGTGAIMGVIDISGPPTTYQRNNLGLAVAAARQIEMVLTERSTRERMQLLETCLRRLSSADAAGIIVIDRHGRLVQTTGRVSLPIRVGERVPGLDRSLAVERWADRLPESLRPEWFNPVIADGRAIGALLVVPDRPRLRGRAAGQGSEADPARSAFAHIIGDSPAMAAVIDRARRLVGKRVPVLVEGETGVGKELFARAIHGEEGEASPFIAFNCAATSKELLASELFGHVRGAFTGATSEGRPGRFELADGGTLCLDEVGELPLDLQPMLLRVLEEGVVYRLGDAQPRRVDVRLLALTNRSLRDEVEAGRFRRDLYHRISVTRLLIPPLRERGDDLELLVAHFNRRLAARHQVPERDFPPDVLSRLQGYAWLGNVRELRNVVESLLLISIGGTVTHEDLPPELGGDDRKPGETSPSLDRPEDLYAAERVLIAEVLRRHRYNFVQAARALGISRSTLYRKVQNFGLDVEG